MLNKVILDQLCDKQLELANKHLLHSEAGRQAFLTEWFAYLETMNVNDEEFVESLRQQLKKFF